MPVFQRFGEVGRALECLKADTAAGFGRYGPWWWSPLLPAALAVDAHTIFLGSPSLSILTYSQTITKCFFVALTAKTQFVNVVVFPLKIEERLKSIKLS